MLLKRSNLVAIGADHDEFVDNKMAPVNAALRETEGLAHVELAHILLYHRKVSTVRGGILPLRLPCSVDGIFPFAWDLILSTIPLVLKKSILRNVIVPGEAGDEEARGICLHVCTEGDIRLHPPLRLPPPSLRLKRPNGCWVSRWP